MLSILGSLIGFAGSAVPAVLGHFENKQKQKNDLEILKVQGELAKQGVEMNLMEFRERAADDEHRRLIEHDISMQNDTGLMGALRKSVRPVITYMFFGLFAAVKVSTLMMALESNDFNTAINMVWDEETQAIFAAIISFWFGSRALSKNKK